MTVLLENNQIIIKKGTKVRNVQYDEDNDEYILLDTYTSLPTNIVMSNIREDDRTSISPLTFGNYSFRSDNSLGDFDTPLYLNAYCVNNAFHFNLQHFEDDAPYTYKECNIAYGLKCIWSDESPNPQLELLPIAWGWGEQPQYIEEIQGTDGDVYIIRDKNAINEVKTINGESIVGTGDVKITFDELNNPYTLLEYKYSELEITNNSWLKSNGQWNTKAMYPSVYEKITSMPNAIDISQSATTYYGWSNPSINFYLWTTKRRPEQGDVLYYKTNVTTGEIRVGNDPVESYNRTVDAITFLQRGVSSTTLNRDETLDFDTSLTDYDFAYNSVDEIFRLPIKTKTSFVIDDGEFNGVKYRVWNDGYCEQEIHHPESGGETVHLAKIMRNTDYQVLTNYEDTANSGNAVIRVLSANARGKSSFTTYDSGIPRTFKVCGYLASGQYTPQNLYYYVGDTVQNASLIDVAQVTSALANKVDVSNPVINAPYVIEQYQDPTGTFGFITFSNGQCIQYGRDETTTKAVTITLIKTYKDTNYVILNSHFHNSYGSYVNGYMPTSGNTFTINKYDTNVARKSSWMTIGKLEEGQY